MEWNDTQWMENGYPGDEPNNFLGRGKANFSDAGLRFHLRDLNQGDQFAFAQLRFISSASVVDSNVELVMLGADRDSVPQFSQENRPSQMGPFTTAKTDWNFSGWEVSQYPLYIYSPDVSHIINEILGRPGWGSEGQETVALLIENQTAGASEFNYVGFQDYYDGDRYPAVLILYESVIDTFIGGPVLSRATEGSISISLVARMETDLYIEYGTCRGDYTHAVGNSQTTLPAVDPVMGLGSLAPEELKIAGLTPNTRYFYRLRARPHGSDGPFEAGSEYSFITGRPAGEFFSFAVLSDSHVGLNRDIYDDDWKIGYRTMALARETDPDFFIVNGDEAAISEFPEEAESEYDTDLRYSLVRQFYGLLGNTAALFLVLGNHDGEASYHDPNLQLYSYNSRKKMIFNPENTTYPYGGAPKDNYFAWEWGDALFVCLDIFSYTGPEDPTDIQPYGSAWHLGEEQLNWLENVLSASEARWKFLFAHHILASYEKSGYGRGGAKYAHDWEQGIIHKMMLNYGAQIFFYGHDHVFADGTADGIHYTCCSQCFLLKQPNWTIPFSRPYYYFRNAYPYGYFADKGHVSVKVGPRSIQVDFVRTSLEDDLNGDIIYSYHLADVMAQLVPSDDMNFYPKDLFEYGEEGNAGVEMGDSGPGRTMTIDGENIIFDAVFTNKTGQVQSFDYWIRVTLPGGDSFIHDLKQNEVLGPADSSMAQKVGLSPSKTIGYTFFVPAREGPGTYVFTVEAGTYPHEVISSHSLKVKVP